MKKSAMKHFHIKSIFAALLLVPVAASAAEIRIVGLFTGKAVVVVDDGKPRTLSLGQTSPEGIKLIAADSTAAIIEFEGRRQTLPLASGWRIPGSSLGASSGAASSVTLTADSQGHYQTLGQVNGGTVQFLVDTGATSIALPSADARRLGINYLAGDRGYTQTANGRALAYRIKLDTVKVGDITLHGVDAVVLEGDGLKIALLGMSFLSRTDMKRDGQALTLTRRY